MQRKAWKNSSHAVTYLDVGWTCGGMVHSAVRWLSEPEKYHQYCLMSSVQSFYGLCLRSVVHSLTCSFLGICHSSTCPPNVQVGHHNLPGLSRVSINLILQATNTGEKRPGYEAWVQGLGTRPGYEAWVRGLGTRPGYEASCLLH